MLHFQYFLFFIREVFVEMKCEKFKREKLELAYRAHVFDVYNDHLVLPDGRRVVYDLIKHSPGACVLPVCDDGRIILVRQYRNAIDEITYEVPAGFIDAGETPEDAAIRELREETGYIAGNVEYVTKTVLAIGTSDEQTYIYIGRDLTLGKPDLDENEFINYEYLELKDVDRMIKSGEIVDSKTLIAIYAYKCSLT